MRNPSEAALSDFLIFETDEFLKTLKKLSAQDATFIRNKIDSFVYPLIKKEPFWGNNIKKLKGFTPEIWRYRIGDFRLFYIVDQEEQIINILTIDDRKNAYK